MPDNIGPMSSWKPIVFICLGLFILGAIAAVIVVSLITLYLKPKGDDLAADNTSNENNTLYMVFATDLKDASNYLVLDPNSFAEQINQYLNSPLYKLLVQSFSFVHSSGSINTGVNQRKKRQQRASVSCSAEGVEKNQTANNGDKLDAVFYIDKNRTNMCKHGFCTPQQLSTIQRKIESKLASKSFVFNAELGDGTAISITTVFCSFGTVLSCQDGIKNRDETDIDCGGETCPSCADLKNCIVSSDCVSKVCTSGICQVPTCHDNVKNGNETDVDCGGGTCASCASSKNCIKVSDCVGGVCTSGICQAITCTDNVKNQDETDVDCGGTQCSQCLDGKNCIKTSDCVSGVCPSGICLAPTCGDDVKNQGETDVDCGGTHCDPCSIGKHCLATSDCITNSQCQSGTCQGE